MYRYFMIPLSTGCVIGRMQYPLPENTARHRVEVLTEYQNSVAKNLSRVRWCEVLSEKMAIFAEEDARRLVEDYQNRQPTFV